MCRDVGFLFLCLSETFENCFLGAPGVGRNEIKKMLLSSSPDKFITTVPRKILKKLLLIKFKIVIYHSDMLLCIRNNPPLI